MNVENSAELRRRIEALKREKNAIILAHYYTKPEVQAVADFLGDSLALSVRAQQVEARIILFAGVHFMAETAKVLCPDKKVLIPCPEAGCSLAESCDAKEFAAFKAKYPGYKVVSYVNTTVGVKALTDVCCTSSNALKVVESLPADLGRCLPCPRGVFAGKDPAAQTRTPRSEGGRTPRVPGLYR